jgi:2-octaprenyl-6-methoxyphenol hydroxylase
MCAALAFANAGFSVALIGPKRVGADQRTTALMLPAINLLSDMGVWQDIVASAAPLKKMRILDGTTRLIRSQPVTFHASTINEEAFGWNMPNESLLEALEGSIAKAVNLTRFDALVSSVITHDEGVSCELGNGANIQSKLLIGADGRNSLARKAAAIEVRQWSYPQVAMVLAFAHTRSHQFISTEFHTQTGPFTIVPLPGDRSSLVWVVHPSDVGKMREKADGDLAIELEEKMHSILGKITLDTPRQFYPLSGQTPSAFAASRIMLVGEAAHVFPPIGAQGLNLGLRDVSEALKSALESREDPGAPKAMKTYNAARRADILLRTGAVDLLNRSLLSDFLPVQLARSLGLGLLSSVPTLRDIFMREGMRPGSGIRAMFERRAN